MSAPHDLQLDLAHLLGRPQTALSQGRVPGLVEGRRVLVTGAGGSIGLELCREIATLEPAALTMLDHDETALHGVELALTGRGLLDSPDLVLCDIRDADAVAAALQRCRPHIVFHAAALKHLPILERFPAEAIKTNVLGTSNVLAASREAAVDRFVNISTDKAADPTSVLGYTKRVAERLTAGTGLEGPGTYVSVRFGNVLGSRGSALDTFRRQILAGGPVTLTDIDATRYFMTVAEACHLIFQAAVIGRPAEALVLDMGDPVRMLDIAERLMDLLDRRVELVLTGLRPGEKLHEDLFGADEPHDVRPEHPRISHVEVPPLAAQDLLGLLTGGDLANLRDRLRDLSGARTGSKLPAPRR